MSDYSFKPQDPYQHQPYKPPEGDLPIGVDSNPLMQNVPMEELSPKVSTGVNYREFFSSIGKIFQQLAKFAEDSLASRGIIKNATVLPQEKMEQEKVKTKEVKFAENPQNQNSKSFQIATSNVGMDGAYNKFHMEIEDQRAKFKDDPRASDENFLIQQCFEEKFEKLSTSIKELSPNAESKELKQFLNTLNQLLKNKNANVNEDQTERLTQLVKFLENLDNRIELKSACETGTTFTPGTSDFERNLNNLNEAIFSLYHFSKIQDKLALKKNNQSMSEYLEEKNLKRNEERFRQLDKDVLFLQEFNVDKSILAEKFKNSEKNIAIFASKGDRGGDFPSLIINKDRFEIVDFPQGNIKKSDPINDFVTTQIEIPSPRGKKMDKENLKIYDDNQSFGTSKFRGVIAIDKVTKKKVLLCSIHIPGYGIGMESKDPSSQVNIMRKMVEKIAADHDVDGIIMGGDFNSVEEDIGALKSPLTPLREGKYMPISFAGDTENPPYAFFQAGYDLSRKIDHIFVKWLKESKDSLIGSDGRVLGKLKEYLKPTVFDHLPMEAEMKPRLPKDAPPSLKSHKIVPKKT